MISGHILDIFLKKQPTEFPDGLAVENRRKRVLDYKVLGVSY